LLAVLALGIATRLYHLAEESVWLDEAITFSRASLSPSEVMTSSIRKMHVPTYFLLMHHVLPFGDDEWTLRLPSALFGILKIGLVAGAGFVAGGPRAAIAAGLVLVLSPSHLRYDQEARMYAMQTFGTCLALWAQLWLLAHPHRAVHGLAWGKQASPAGTFAPRVAWAAWVGGVVLALYSHNTSALYLLASSLATLPLLALDRTTRWPFFWRWTAANLLVLLAWSPWLPSLASQLGARDFVGKNGWGGVPELADVWAQARRLLLGGRSWALNLLSLGLMTAGIWQLRKRPVLLAALLILSLGALGSFWVVSLRKPMFLPRLMLWGGPAFYVLLGCGVLALRRAALQALLLVLLVVLGGTELQRGYYAKMVKTDWRGTARLLSAERASGALVFTSSFKEKKPLSYYGARNTDRIELPALHEADVMPAGKRLRELLQRAPEVLFVRSAAATAASAASRFLAKRGRLHSRTALERVVIDRYRMRDACIKGTRLCR
jgi:mannosyltransferase